MNQFLHRRRLLSTALAGTLVSLTTDIRPVFADKSAVKMQKWRGAIDYQPGSASPFTLQGNASHLGKFNAVGEVFLVPTDDEGVLIGTGPVVFTAANGDRLVGQTTWFVNGENESEIHFAWRDAVVFSDGTVATNTGRFVSDRPPGLVVIAIIAILIGLLVPAQQ